MTEPFDEAATLPSLAGLWTTEAVVNGGTLALVVPPWGGKALRTWTAGDVQAKASLAQTEHQFHDGSTLEFWASYLLGDDTDADLLFLLDLESSTLDNNGVRLRLRGNAPNRLSWDLEGIGDMTPPASVDFPRNRKVVLHGRLVLSAGAAGSVQLWQDGALIMNWAGIRTIQSATAIYNHFEVGSTINSSPNAHTLLVDDVVVCGG